MYLQKVIWITGLSGAGKTTTGQALSRILTDRGFKVLHLDGDDIRLALRNFEATRRYDKVSRLKNAYTYADLAVTFSRQCDFLIVSTISMFKEIYEHNREKIPHYFEVFLDVPEEIRKKRDKKNIYPTVDAETKTNICGLDLQIDPPIFPDFTYRFKEGEKSQDVAILVAKALDSLSLTA